jgi:type II secretory pathway component GspD/PulD (secretin)/tetratricopeptide (TPR) repeat protein
MLVAVGAALSSSAVLAQSAAPATQPLGASAPAAAPSASLTRVDTMLKNGQVVAAKAELAKMLRPTSGGKTGYESLSGADQKRVMDLFKQTERSVAALDPVEAALQRAEISLNDWDIVGAERQLNVVLQNPTIDAARRERASALAADAATRKDELRPLVSTTLDRAVSDFESRRFAEAKTGFAAVSRSGVTLTDAQQRIVDQYQLRIISEERRQGTTFQVDDGASMALMQPGKVRRLNESKGAEPAREPVPEQPAAESFPAPAPAAVPATAGEMQPTNTGEGTSGQPAPAPAPQPSQPSTLAPAPGAAPAAAPQDDLITQAMRVDAQRLMAEADLAYQNARYNEAIEKYTIALTSSRQYLSGEEIARAETNRTEAQVRLQSNTAGSLDKQFNEGQRIIRERASATFDNELAQADASLAAGNTVRAQELVARARLTINQSRSAFSQTEYAEFMRRADDKTRQIGIAAETIAQNEARTQEETRAKQATEAADTHTREKQRKIDEAIDRVRALQMEQKYEEALQVCDQILFLEPNNPTGLLLKDIIGNVILYTRFNEVQKRKAREIARFDLAAAEATIPITGTMEFPSDWPTKTFDRADQGAFSETPEDRRVLGVLDSKRIPVDFNENNLSDVLEFIQTVTGVNIDVDWEALRTELSIERETPVTLKLSNATVRSVLDRVLAKASASSSGSDKANWAVNDGMLLVAPNSVLNRNTTLVIYNITDLMLEIPNYPDAPQIDLEGVLQQSQGGGGGQSPFNTNEDERPTREELEQRRQDRLTRLLDIIRSNVDPEGWRDAGGDVGTIQELNNSLIIRNTPRNHREITGLLSKLREIRSMQINVETKFLLVNQDWFEQIGFDLDIVLNANNNQVRFARDADPTIQGSDFFNFGSDLAAGSGRGLQRVVNGANAPVALRDPATGALVLDDNNQPIFVTGVNQQGVINPRNWSPVGAQQNSLGLGANLASDNSFATGILQQAPALGIAGQFLDDIQVDFLIAATQADRRSVQLTAPRLTFTNGQTANIFVVTQQAFVSDLTPVVADSAVGFDPDVSVASEGVTLLVEGVISADRRYVTMNVDAGVSRIDGFGREAVTAVAGGQLVSSASTQSFIQLPTITVTRVRTTVTVPDEGTVLLGGQRLVTELEIETGVPVLSKLPIINRFFTNRIESKEEQTLLILVKPTVLIQTEEEAKNFPGLADQMQTGLGLR